MNTAESESLFYKLFLERGKNQGWELHLALEDVTKLPEFKACEEIFNALHNLALDHNNTFDFGSLERAYYPFSLAENTLARLYHTFRKSG